MTSPFTSMATALAAKGRAHHMAFSTVLGRAPAGASRTERIRELLRQQGPLSAKFIATELDLPNQALVGALLKADLHAGRAVHQAGRYQWNYDHDELQADEIAAAIRLLKKNGYSVESTSA